MTPIVGLVFSMLMVMMVMMKSMAECKTDNDIYWRIQGQVVLCSERRMLRCLSTT